MFFLFLPAHLPWEILYKREKKSKAKGLETIRSNRACSCWDTRSWVPNRNDLFLVSSTTKTLLIGAPSQGQTNSPHSLRIHIYTHKHNRTTTPSSATCSLGAEHSSSPSLSSLSLHLCLSQSLWGVGLSAERGDCSIAEKMYKMLSPLFCWALSVYSRILEQYRKPLCSALKMSTWIWSSCIANNYKCGLELRHAQTHTHTHIHIQKEGKRITYHAESVLGIYCSWLSAFDFTVFGVGIRVEYFITLLHHTLGAYHITDTCLETSAILRHAHSSSLPPCNWCLWCFKISLEKLQRTVNQNDVNAEPV